MMETTRLTVPNGEAITVKLDRPESGPIAGGVVLAHGQGNDLDLPLLAAVARDLAENGLAAIRFNFPYREAGRERPDASDLLLECLLAVHGDLLQRASLTPDRVILGGKSLGSRIATMAVMRGHPAAGLLHLGFPLQPPGRPDRARPELIREASRVPQCFLAGALDPLSPLEWLKELVAAAPGAEIHVISEANHGFARPGEQEADADVIAEISAVSVRWATGLLAA